MMHRDKMLPTSTRRHARGRGAYLVNGVLEASTGGRYVGRYAVVVVSGDLGVDILHRLVPHTGGEIFDGRRDAGQR